MTSSSTDLLATGQRVIRREAGALATLAEGLDENFAKAVTLLMAGGAWALAGEAQRALAVLVIATPCPLILAVPVALLAGPLAAPPAGHPLCL